MSLLLLFVLILLIKREGECGRERTMGTVVIENGIAGFREMARRTTGGRQGELLAVES
jgi:hypothetical protein